MSSTATKPRTLTTSQADSLLNVLKQPLAGRSVLVPFSNVAFVNGTLSPTLDEQGNEQVILANEVSSSQSTATADSISTATTATIQEAQDWLKQFSSSSSAKKRAPSKLPSALKKTPPPTKTTPSSSSSVPGDPHPTVPFVDIQEQYDPDGTQTSGTVVDVTQQLQQMLNPNATVATSPPPTAATTSTADKEDENFSTIPEPEPLKPLSDLEYQDLSDRLEALARLEEEKTQDTNPLAGRKQPTPSSKKKTSATTKNSSNGWSKGFLLSSKKKTAPKATATTTKTAPSVVPPAATSATTVSPEPLSSSTSTAAAGTNPRSVTFDASPQIQEIPRIGTQRVPPKPTAVGTPTPPPTTSKPLETSMFSGVIQERSATAAVVSPRMPVNAASRRNPTEQPKRRSRFAQERQGNV
eukprot:Nitzschia sp. Nitz4//scaffold28_size193895//152553//153785//NITZ4_001681-RA/size193895-processed-gene-0.236-mRNA-1//1//CDS//3329546030//2682//frame0